MSIQQRAVRVHQIPADSAAKAQQAFLHELRQHAEAERPRFVIDCVNIASMTPSTINLLVCCLEEAMKRNGDVRLASLHSEALGALAAAGLDRLFETFDTIEAAILSFQRRSISMAPFVNGTRTAEQAA
jgi:anti-anti-sigma factor